MVLPSGAASMACSPRWSSASASTRLSFSAIAQKVKHRIDVQHGQRKFGDHLRAKTDTAMMKEVLCKILCDNICRLTHSMFEPRIETKFWQDDEPQAQPHHPVDNGGFDAFAWI
jgi:hypothetical protein